jgi:hypothetical protein
MNQMVVVEINGGVADVILCPEGVSVRIADNDLRKVGEDCESVYEGPIWEDKEKDEKPLINPVVKQRDELLAVCKAISAVPWAHVVTEELKTMARMAVQSVEKGGD